MSGMQNLHFVLFLLMVTMAVVSTYPGLFDPNRREEAFGRQYFVVLPVEADTSIRSVHNILLSSRSREVVQAFVSRPDSSWIGPKVRIQPGIVANITIDMTGTIRHPFNLNGIAVQIDAKDDVAAWVIPGRGDSILGGYRALPREALGKYYSGVMYPAASTFTSEILIYSPGTLSNQISLFHDQSNLAYSIDNVTNVFYHNSSIWIPMMNSAKIFSTSDLSGLDISGSEVMSVVSGRHCRAAISQPAAADQCSNLMEQLSPLQVWGRSFVIVPQVSPGPDTLMLRVITATVNTTVSTYDAAGMMMENWTMSDENSVKEVPVSAGKPITIRADEPIMVTQFFTGPRRRLDYAAMLIVPPVEQFTNSTVVFPVLNHTVFTNILILVTRCEHKGDILLNDKSVADKFLYNVIFSEESNFTVHGHYCTLNTTLSSGSHKLRLRDGANIGAAYSAILYGTGGKQSYAYQVAADMREIICDVKGRSVQLCDFYVPPDYMTSSTIATSLSADRSKSSKGPDHTIAIIVVLSVLSFFAALIVGVIIFGSCGKDRLPKVAWSRLQDSSNIHYEANSEDDDTVRMDHV